ncbi:carbohydrate-binding protein [Paenibacillus sp. LMG 31461]|uniref:Carbohydrate-binding protein n=1 Tax=Paenibacillus plantarum TaxID=2654975 RepID=A0ABX1XNN7_9BACL|nr:right-handed parallel beta-helix repeat-containing protein [Paenibacillus plantarum]NOU69439.1 carbohydrate-binding protein [Paenibacillus plantarum]
MEEMKGNHYYVAINGDDSNDGITEQSPFRTISQAAQRMEAGDTCYIREGTYRETIIPTNSGKDGAPIRFEAFQRERVVVSGCDEITEWMPHKGSVYKGKVTWDLLDGSGNLVFFDEELGMEAQWPSLKDRLDKSQYAVVDAATNEYPTYTLYDEDLKAFPDGHWDGAMVACVNGVSYFMSTARVTGFEAGTLYHDQWVSSAEHYRTQPGNLYFITRTLQALDTEKEWYYNADERMLYIIAPGGGHPSSHTVEAKRRDYAFDLRNKQHIQIIGVDCRGASMTTKGASHCQIRKSRMYGLDRSFGYRQTIYGRTHGIELGGSDNLIRDCEISHFEGIGVYVSDERNAVMNCYIHDGNFEASYASMIWLTGSEHKVSRCTITRGGRTSISGVFARSVIEYCDVSFANALTKDSGMIYLFNHDFDNTQIHHNWLHDNLSDHLSFGFYMDAWTSGVSFFRNVIWNIPERGMVLNRPIQRTLIYNNTFYRKAIADSSVFCFDDMYGTHMANNLFADGEIRRWGNHSVVSHNRFDVEPCFVDAERGDFRLRPESPVIGKGTFVAGVTDNHTGEAPDVGAYEWGGEGWIPGHDFGSRQESKETGGKVIALDHESRIRNGGFETGALAPWRKATGSPRIVFECAWDYSRNGAYPSVVRSNKYAAVLHTGDRIEQFIEGLKPNTTYMFYAGIKSGGEYRLATEHSERSSSGLWDKEPDGNWAIYRDVRYVGPWKSEEWLKFSDIDFGSLGKYDVLSIGLNKMIGPVTIEVRIDRLNGELIGAVVQKTDYNATWNYFGTPLSLIGGVHDVYLVFSGEGQCLVHNLVIHNSFRAATARMSVSGHDAEEVQLTVNRWNWESTMSELYFTTGEGRTSATVAIENLGGQTVMGLPGHNIYVDDCGLWIKPQQI